MGIPKLVDADVSGKRVLLRVDLDVSEVRADDLRLKSMVPTVGYLLENGAAQIFLAGHLGRHKEGGTVKDTKILLPVIKELLGENEKIVLLENLRSTEAEENNDLVFAKKLANMADIYVNDAFASSHRNHASIVSVPKYLPGYIGLRFEKEIENLQKVLNGKRPAVIVVSGIKRDKVDYAKALAEKFDSVLVGGRLPEYFGEDFRHPKMILARLIQDKEDITIHSIELFEEKLKQAQTIVLAGVLGKYEEEGHMQGTKRIFEAVAGTEAFKVAGGGDTETALNIFGLNERFNWISVGGGAMLEFLCRGTLPGIEALIH